MKEIVLEISCRHWQMNYSYGASMIFEYFPSSYGTYSEKLAT